MYLSSIYLVFAEIRISPCISAPSCQGWSPLHPTPPVALSIHSQVTPSTRPGGKGGPSCARRSSLCSFFKEGQSSQADKPLGGVPALATVGKGKSFHVPQAGHLDCPQPVYQPKERNPSRNWAMRKLNPSGTSDQPPACEVFT
uniref:Uncharacterized protein n=1 Tax=Myotis myotis TaxID=51298 RepID=A0A7J7TTS2_MYOMY|nr:hypothetical protein mMyoMyo1_008970 [Myotis myotis]